MSTNDNEQDQQQGSDNQAVDRRVIHMVGRVEMVPAPRPGLIKKRRKPPQPRVAPTWQEMDACVSASTGWQQKLATILRYTGLRPGEVMLAERRDLDLDKGTPILGRNINMQHGLPRPSDPALEAPHRGDQAVGAGQQLPHPAPVER